MITITAKERDLLKGILTADHRDGHGSAAEVWSDCLNSTVSASSIGGVMASLQKKGLVYTDGEAVAITEAGHNFYLTLTDLDDKEARILARPREAE